MAGTYNGVPVPVDGKKIGYAAGKYNIPDNPIVPFIEGDGTGRDIWKASLRVFDAAVEKAYKGKRRVAWYEVFAGEKAKARFDTWLPDETVEAIREFRHRHVVEFQCSVGGSYAGGRVGIRGPEFGLAIRGAQCVDGELFGVAVERKVESIGEERLQHEAEAFGGNGSGRLGYDVVSVRSEDDGPNDLEVPDVVGPLDAGSQTDIAHGESRRCELDGFAWRLFEGGGCFAEFYGGDFEGG